MYFLNKDFNLVFLKKIFYCLLFCFIILIFDGAIQFIFGQNLFGFDLIYPGPRVSSFFGEELVLGSYLSRLFQILFGLYIFFYSSKKKLYYLFLLSFLTILLILTSGERTALFLSILSFLLIFLLIYENNKFLKKFFYSIIFFVIVILSVSETLRTRIVDVTINEMFLSDNNDKKIRIFTRQHEEHYISALRMFQMSPILGVGVKNFRNFCDKKEFKISDYTCSPHPHNTYIQIISETGLLGFMIILIVFFGINYKMFKHFLSSKDGRPIFKDLEICLLVSIYLTLWPLTPSGNFFNNWISIIYYYPVGIFMWSINRKSKN
jgi:O-antigen ligase